MRRAWLAPAVVGLGLTACAGPVSSNPPPVSDFGLGLSPARLTIPQGGTVSTTVRVSRSGDHAGPVSFNLDGAPAGVTGSFSPMGTTSDSSTLSLQVASSAPAGTHGLTIRGRAGSLERIAALALTITRAGPTFGAVSTFAGTAGNRGSTDGQGSAASFNYPVGITADPAGNLYVAGLTESIRKIAWEGTVTTIAGGNGSGSVDGPALSAKVRAPQGIAWSPTGELYWTEDDSSVLRKLTPSGQVVTVAGLAYSPGAADGRGSAARFNRPDGVTVVADGSIYVADTANFTIRKVTASGVVSTVAGLAGASGRVDGTGAAARFAGPQKIVVEPTSGDLFVTDGWAVRRVTPSGVVTTLAGNPNAGGHADGTGSAARFERASGIAIDIAGNLYVTDASKHVVRKVTPAGVVTTLAGVVGIAGSADGSLNAASFSGPSDAVMWGDTLVVADTYNQTIRKIR